MTRWRTRALLGASAAALLIAFVPFGTGAVHEFGVLKRIAEERAALLKAEGLSIGSLPHGLAALGWEASADALSASLVQREIDAASTANLEIPTPPEPLAAAPEAPAASTASLEVSAPPEAPAIAPQSPAASTASLGISAAPESPAATPEPLAASSQAAAPEAPAAPSQAAPGQAATPAAAPLSPAALAYRKGDAAALTALANASSDPDERLALEWAALRADPHPPEAALAAFATAHPNWPENRYFRTSQEADLLVHPLPPSAVLAFFAADPPQSSAGALALARANAAMGHVDEAIGAIRELWRDGDFDSWTEGQILREFGVALLRADHKARADRLLYAENYGPALRAAALAGADEMALAEVRIAAARGPLSPALLKAAPQALKNDPGLLFARIQDARRSGRAFEAATLIGLAPKDRAALINPDKWWTERRMVARELLDLNEPKLAYEICDKAARPDEAAAQVDLDFHAGWIALRFLGDAPAAAKWFALAAEAADTPLSIARAAYWRGRAAEAMNDVEDAALDYESAASEPIAYYGQLAAERLGVKRLQLRAPVAVAEGEARDEAVRATEALYRDGLDDLATALAFEAAREWRDEAQMAAMAAVVKRYGEAATQLQFGKIATIRGYDFDAMAFPSKGVPAFVPLAHSADLASVYAVARQESEFLWRAASGAGAKGLMQILPATAASTARRAGVQYDPVRLIVDPAFNTQLGAAFLGQVMEDIGGSPELAFAAYNAGPGRVAQWIAAYGDPRKGTTADLVDWIERIPFDETRDYVQRVAENLGVYKQRLADEPPAPAPVSVFAAKE
jgi:soluble lytic murein transglycosylase